MKEKLVGSFNFFRRLSYRDAVTFTTTTLSGALIGVFRSIGKPEEMQCNVLCDSAYGAYSGIAFTLAFHFIDYLMNRPEYQEIDLNNERTYVII